MSRFRPALVSFIKIYIPYLFRFFFLIHKGYSIIPFRKLRIRGSSNLKEISRSAIITGCVLDVKGDGNFISIKEGAFLNGVKIIVRGNSNRIIVCPSVSIGSRSTIWIEGNNCVIKVGKNTTVESALFATTDSDTMVLIGEDCMLAYGVEIRAGDSHTIIDLSSKKRLNHGRSVVLDSNVWVAAHVVILKGVVIGSGSIIATKSVVTKEFKERNVLVGGVPAKILRSNISWKR